MGIDGWMMDLDQYAPSGKEEGRDMAFLSVTGHFCVVLSFQRIFAPSSVVFTRVSSPESCRETGCPVTLASQPHKRERGS